VGFISATNALIKQKQKQKQKQKTKNKIKNRQSPFFSFQLFFQPVGLRPTIKKLK
jgi:hypothetical protein